jgi:hypothetical protein
MLATKITTHVQDALARFMQQYKGRPRFAAYVSALVDQIQDLENAYFDLDFGRSVYGSVGVQLDLLGTLVGISRNGLPDSEYILFILGKIGEDTSDTTIDKVAAVYGILLNSPITQEQDLYPAGVGLATGSDIDQSLVQIVWEMVQNSLGAGIRLEFLEVFDPVDAFAFAGSAGTALGFGDDLNPLTGGKFGRLLDPNFAFAFDTPDVTDLDLGFGDLRDPILGGELQDISTST